MEKYNINLLENSYTVEIPFADHMQLMDAVDDSIGKCTSLLNDMESFVRKLDKYVEGGDITKDVADHLKRDRGYQIEELKKRIDVATKFIESVQSI